MYTVQVCVNKTPIYNKTELLIKQTVDQLVVYYEWKSDVTFILLIAPHAAASHYEFNLVLSL